MAVTVNVLTNEKKELEFEVIGADQSLLRLLVEKLNADKGIEFAAYKQEHPIAADPRVYVKTSRSDALDTVLEKLEEIENEISGFKKKFKESVK